MVFDALNFFLDALIGIFRAAPWLVWVGFIPVIVAVRNKGIALVQSPHHGHHASNEHAHHDGHDTHENPHARRNMAVVFGTLLACLGLMMVGLMAYRQLAAL